jgi:hypothetical protein
MFLSYRSRSCAAHHTRLLMKEWKQLMVWPSYAAVLCAEFSGYLPPLRLRKAAAFCNIRMPLESTRFHLFFVSPRPCRPLQGLNLPSLTRTIRPEQSPDYWLMLMPLPATYPAQPMPSSTSVTLPGLCPSPVHHPSMSVLCPMHSFPMQ